MAEEKMPEAENTEAVAESPKPKAKSTRSTTTKSTTASKGTKSTATKSTATKTTKSTATKSTATKTTKSTASKSTASKSTKSTATKSTASKSTKSTATKSTATKTTKSTAKSSKPTAEKDEPKAEIVEQPIESTEQAVEAVPAVEQAVETAEAPAESAPAVETTETVTVEAVEPLPATEIAVATDAKASTSTVKQFFKSNTFKCIITLLSILLVCGIFLTIAYGFLEVTPEIRLSRAISKIYGYEVGTPEDLADENGVIENATLENATIMEAYYIPSESDYLIKSKGKGGFGGTVRCWVAISIEDGKITYVSKVVVEGSDGETFLGNIDFLDKYPETPYTGQQFGFITSGASLSSTAINNAVNGAVEFVNGVLAQGGNQ